jgi:hypothetical protein
MATYSMTLREEKGSKLTAAELDGNFLHTMEVMGEMEQQIMASMSTIFNIVLNFGPTVIRKTITSTELKNSYNSPVELAPSQEGYIYTNMSAQYRLVNGTSSYTSQEFVITYDGYDPMGASPSLSYHLTSARLNQGGDPSQSQTQWTSVRSSNQFTDELPIYSNTSLVLFTPTDIISDGGDYDIELIMSVQVIQTFPF